MYGHFRIRNFFQHAPSKVATYDIASIIMHCNKVCNSVHTHKVNRIGHEFESTAKSICIALKYTCACTCVNMHEWV